MLPCVEGEQAQIVLRDELRDLLQREFTAMDERIDGPRERRGRLAGCPPDGRQVPERRAALTPVTSAPVTSAPVTSAPVEGRVGRQAGGLAAAGRLE